MARFAKGKHAYGISDRSGFRYPLHKMRKEWNGLLVGPDEWEAKHPQLEPRHTIVDGQALKDARPDRTEPLDVFVGTNTVGQPVKRPTAFGLVGKVGVTTS